MTLRHTGITALLLLATCAEGTHRTPTVESAGKGIGSIPSSEVAVWQKMGSSSSPASRYLQAAAFDETRKVLVMFGGSFVDPSSGAIGLSQDTWEWNRTTAKWTNRTLDGTKPEPRSGAALAYDSARGKLMLFGGRAGSGLDLEDTWEWDPDTGAWTEVGSSSHPSARSQHVMVFEKSTGKLLLFGGGRSSSSPYDGSASALISFGDTWEYDPATKTWSSRTVTAAPSVRNNSALVWDSANHKAVLFGGLQTDSSDLPGVPKQDTWEWDPAAGTWTERTAVGSKPSPRYGHAMAFDGTRKKVVLFGGFDMGSGLAKSDVWDWEPTTGAWAQRLTGSEDGAPAGRMYASMVSDDAGARLIIVAGAVASGTSGSGGTSVDAAVGMVFSPSPSREIWELDPVTPAFTNKTPPLGAPSARYSPAVAFNPVTGKTCVFGGKDAFSGQLLDDYWEWDGRTWTPLTTSGIGPSARLYAAMAFDPARKTMILFGGGYDSGLAYAGAYADTWELTSTGSWSKLNPASHPDARNRHGMVTDTTRNRILLFGGMTGLSDGRVANLNDVWEWDGAALTWTNRTPLATTHVPDPGLSFGLAYDEGRRKLFHYFAVWGQTASSFSEWDPVSGGWAARGTSDSLDQSFGGRVLVTYDSARRREIILAGALPSSGAPETWEVDTVGPTWYVRVLPVAPYRLSGGLVFDSQRGVVVYVGSPDPASTNDTPLETWEYKVTGLGDGEGCAAATASQCASGFCVDGVCCNVAACTGACQSCNVPGSEGTCALAKAGTEVASSCESGKACDGTGSCKAKSGLPCTSATECASGFCADGVCCDGACTGPCVSCSQAGRVGQCAPYPADTDPQNECGQGSGLCKSACDGAGNCAFPQAQVSCGDCLTCDGHGSCANYDPTRCSSLPLDGGPYQIDTALGPLDTAPHPPVDARDYPEVGSGGAGGTWLPDGGPRSGGGSDGSMRDLGGSGVDFGGTGGRGGDVPGAGGSSTDKRDGAVGDAAPTVMPEAGCGCALGQPPASLPGSEPLVIALGLALLLVHNRRRRARMACLPCLRRQAAVRWSAGTPDNPGRRARRGWNVRPTPARGDGPSDRERRPG